MLAVRLKEFIFIDCDKTIFRITFAIKFAVELGTLKPVKTSYNLLTPDNTCYNLLTPVKTCYNLQTYVDKEIALRKTIMLEEFCTKCR